MDKEKTIRVPPEKLRLIEAMLGRKITVDDEPMGLVAIFVDAGFTVGDSVRLLFRGAS